MPTGKKKLFICNKVFFSLCSNFTNPLMFLFICKFDRTVNQTSVL